MNSRLKNPEDCGDGGAAWVLRNDGGGAKDSSMVQLPLTALCVSIIDTKFTGGVMNGGEVGIGSSLRCSVFDEEARAGSTIGSLLRE